MGNKSSNRLNESLLGANERDPSASENIYKISKEDIQVLFSHRRLRGGGLDRSLSKLREYGYADNLISSLDSDQFTGIDGDIQDLQRRESRYGKNNKPLP